MRALLVVLALPLLAGSTIDHSKKQPPKPEPQPRFRLELHIGASQPGTFFTAWANADVIANHDASNKRPVTYRRKFYWSDGCKWESTERLTPTNPDRYEYAYTERATACPKGRTADPSVTRTGHVTVHKIETTEPITPLDAWVVGWDQPQN